MLPKLADFGVGGGFAALAQYRQFIIYRLVPTEIPGKFDKIPLSPYTQTAINAHDPSQWVMADVALQRAQEAGPMHGVAFVFTADDPFFFLDIDDCLEHDPVTGAGNWSKTALDLLAQFPGASVEISSSGRGLHVIGVTVPIPHGCKSKVKGLELYTEKRFVALTGTGLMGSAGADGTLGFHTIVPHFFPADPTPAPSDVIVDGPDSRWLGPEDDTELLERMLNSRGSAAAAFGGRASVRDLWDANEAVLSQVFPDNYGKGRPWDPSLADAALAAHLAFWTGADEGRMERLMRQSGLYREKWDSHRHYLRDLTIGGAAQRQRNKGEFFNDPAAARRKTLTEQAEADTENDPTTPNAGIMAGFTFVTPQEAALLFAKFTYVMARGAIMLHNGRMAKKEQFDAMFGGPRYSIDPANEKTTKSAWEAMLLNPCIAPRRADDLVFNPNRAFGELYKDEDGDVVVNTYRDLRGRMVEGNANPFLDHLTRLIPSEKDREILLHFMAASVQYPHKRIPWAVALQGTEGNGKTIVADILRYAVGRKATHVPRSSELTGKFNGWLRGKLLIVVNDVSVDRQRQVIDTLKVMITDGDMAVEGKGIEQTTETIYANFLFTTNHMDALATHANDRRFAIIKTAQQSVGDLSIYGMDGAYFRGLIDWLENQDGYAKCAHYLRTYPMQDYLNPFILANRAPATESQSEFVTAALSGPAGKLWECIEAQFIGFRGGYMDTYHITGILGEKVPPRTLNFVIRELGYIMHPAWPAGRVNRPFIGGCTYFPRIYVHRDSDAAKIMDREASLAHWASLNKT